MLLCPIRSLCRRSCALYHPSGNTLQGYLYFVCIPDVPIEVHHELFDFVGHTIAIIHILLLLAKRHLEM